MARLGHRRVSREGADEGPLSEEVGGDGGLPLRCDGDLLCGDVLPAVPLGRAADRGLGLRDVLPGGPLRADGVPDGRLCGDVPLRPAALPAGALHDDLRLHDPLRAPPPEGLRGDRGGGGLQRVPPGGNDGAGLCPGVPQRVPSGGDGDGGLCPGDRLHGQEGQLCAEALELLGSFDEKQFLFPNAEKRSFTVPGALDLYSGRAGVAKALVAGGCPWVLTFEITRSSKEDLLLPENQQKVLRLIVLRAVRCVGSALVCKSFSVAMTPPVRSSQFPRGVPWMSAAMKEKVREGNAMSDFNAEVHVLCFESVEETPEEVVYFWTENPDSSFLWRQRKYRRFRRPESLDLFRCDFCRFGTGWRKRTRVATNIPGLKGLPEDVMLLRATSPALAGTTPCAQSAVDRGGPALPARVQPS